MDTRFIPAHRGGSGTPMVCLHGFVDTWRTWELVLPALEREHDVLAPTLAGHAGGPALDGAEIGDRALADAVERAMDEAGFETAHLVGNSLGGYLALLLAARGRARTVVALAPAGGWARDDLMQETLSYFETQQVLVKAAAPHADAILASREGRRRATQFITSNFDHIPAELLAHQLRGAAGCDAALALIDYARREGYRIEPSRIECPVRIIWGTEDRVLSWPSAAARFREEWLPHADWIELAGVGHCPQLDVPLETAELILGFTRR